MKKLFVIITIFGLCGVLGCGHTNPNSPALTNRDVNKVIQKMTDLMLHDVTNPPLASRFFAYTCLAGYEVVSEND
ncbi:MAG: hypothetical protein ABI203_02320, partial [Mucilaginibacter sp.]